MSSIISNRAGLEIEPPVENRVDCVAEADVSEDQYEAWIKSVQPTLTKNGARDGVDFRASVSVVGLKKYKIKWRALTILGAKHLYILLKSLSYVQLVHKEKWEQLCLDNNLISGDKHEEEIKGS